jgi:hypothetical protein
MNLPSHMMNWQAGWWLILAAFATGALLGLFFHKAEFLGGYDAFPRRLVRLGHIALAALGMLNILYGLSPLPEPGSAQATWAGGCLLFGAMAMPTVCFLTAWRTPFRFAFAVPVGLLVAGVLLVVL